MKFDIKRLFLLNNLLTALLPIILIGLISTAAVKSHVIADHDHKSAMLARSLAGQINTYLREPIGTFNLLSRHLQGHEYSHSERRRLLSLLMESYAYFDALYLLDADGVVRQAGLKKERMKAENDYLGMDFSGVEVCRDALQKGRLQWAPSVSMATGEPTMSFCARVDNGTMLAELKLAELGRIINESGTERTFTAFIVDKGGRIIVHPDHEEVKRKENVSNIKLFRDALAGRPVTANFSMHGAELRGTALRIPELEWVLVVTQETRVAMAPVHALQTILFSGMLCTALLALLLGQIGSRVLSRPFQQLTDIAQRVIHEDYTAVKSVASGCEEVRILSATLGRMVDAISAREMALNEQTEELMSTEETLRELNMLLEEKVAERTARLEKAGREMAALNQDLLLRSTALEDANRQLESFAYTVSHDLRAPLRHAVSFAAMLLEEQGERLDEDGVALVRRIMASCSQMEQLIAALLQFSRIALCPINRTLVQPERVVAEIMAELQVELQGREHEVIVHPLPECSADVILLRQVWANLLGNAVKYTKNSVFARIEVGAKTDEKEVTYSVRDNGAGFDMANYDRLFGVFQRLHSSREFEGSGVGLAIVENIIKRHGGRIWAESRVGEGAVFHFTLPLERGVADSVVDSTAPAQV